MHHRLVVYTLWLLIFVGTMLDVETVSSAQQWQQGSPALPPSPQRLVVKDITVIRQQAAIAEFNTTLAPIPMNENFENPWPVSDSGWLIEDKSNPANDYLWGRRDCHPRNGSYAAWSTGIGNKGVHLTCADQYPNNLDTWAIYGPFDLSRATSASLTFYFWGNTEVQPNCTADRLYVASSTDGQKFSKGQYFCGSWEDGTEGAGYFKFTLDLSARLGQSQVYIGFEFKSNDSVTNSGMMIDDLSLDVIQPGATSTSTPMPPTITPVNTPVPTATATPPASSNCRMLNNVKVCADNFTDNAGGWSASGAVRIGNYTTIENANVIANAGALTGSGSVSMITKSDGSRTALFRDNFTVDTTTGLLTPQVVSGAQLLLTNLVGFSIQPSQYQLTLDALKGQISGTINLTVAIPGSSVIKAIGFTLDHSGAVTGALGDINLALGMVTLHIKQAALSANGLTLKDAELQLPQNLGAAKAALSVTDARITSDGQLTFANGNVSLYFPNIKVGGDKGFAIEGAQATLSLSKGAYSFSGAGTFVLPGIGPGTNSCKVGTHFTFASDPPPLRQAMLSIDGCFKIPIGTTGFFLTGVNGALQLDATTVAIDVGIKVQGGPEILGVAAITGEPTAHWDNSWAVGLNGDLTLFKWKAATASLTLNSRDGAQGTLHLSVLGVIDGNGKVHIWKKSDTFHFTGHASVEIQIPTGAILKQCLGICVTIPPNPLSIANAGVDFGEFRVSGANPIYGLKGQVNVLGQSPAFFVDANGNLKFAGSFQQYNLVDQPPRIGLLQRAADDTTYPVTVGNTPALIVAMGRDQGNLTLSLTDPTGRTITPTTTDPAVFYNDTVTQTLYVVTHPQSGNWSVTVGNRTGTEHYLLSILGAPLPATILQPPTVTPNNNGYAITLQATGAPTATYSLFYDEDASGNDGRPIATGIPLSQTSVNWDTRTVPQGAYYVYALVDDPFNAPVIAYSQLPITISDSTPPDTPTNLQAKSANGAFTLSWQPSNALDTNGYRIYYREPGSGTTFITDIPNSQQGSYTQQGAYLNGNWEIAISAYDINGNESARSPVVLANVSLSLISQSINPIYLPLISRN